MIRPLIILTAFVALSAWAGAQGPAATTPLSPEDRLRLLKANSLLIENLVNDGVAMSSADRPVDRAERGRSAARSLVNAIQQAASAEDAERVAELTGLFRVFVSDGLAPMLKEAKRDVPPESPDGKRVRELTETAQRDLNDLKAALGQSDKLTANPRVQEAAKQLEGLEGALSDPR
jgi:hypothetical protein